MHALTLLWFVVQLLQLITVYATEVKFQEGLDGGNDQRFVRSALQLSKDATPGVDLVLFFPLHPYACWHRAFPAFWGGFYDLDFLLEKLPSG